MSAILSADDLNDFISPGVACIKPVEALPLQKPAENEYEVTTEDKVAAEQAPPAQISLTDCLACSGCVTSAEAILVSLQSHAEVLNVLDSALSVPIQRLQHAQGGNTQHTGTPVPVENGTPEKIFVASISPQVRASIATTYGTTEREAGYMIEQLLCGPQGLCIGGKYGNRFALAIDSNAMREVGLVMEAERINLLTEQGATTPKATLSSACPGWICYAEKTHPHVLPHLSPLKSPQALSGTLLKTVLSQQLGLAPSNIWHLAVMPCFDKKLEAARQELTDAYWRPQDGISGTSEPVRDVDCVITARELLMLADSRGISFPSLPRQALPPTERASIPDPNLNGFLSRRRNNYHRAEGKDVAPGTSGGYLYHVLCTQKAKYPGSQIRSERGRNADIIDYTVVLDSQIKFRGARYYGFRNIQNLVRKLKPATHKSRMPGAKFGATRKAGSRTTPGELENAYVEVMACPGGCTNGGGQIKLADLGELQAADRAPAWTQKDWLAAVDEAYYSMDEVDTEPKENSRNEMNGDSEDIVNGISTSEVHAFVAQWAATTGIDRERLLYTSFREVESDVGKVRGSDAERVVEIASKDGGGW